ncbi:MAG: hypothetical protein ACR2K2_11665 [Mycobacteriales bacterium]
MRLHIHETANGPAAKQWWSDHTGVPLDRFGRSTIKRHNPKTVRQSRGEGYRGCLCVCVLQGRELYRVLDGLTEGLATGRRDIEQWHDDLDVLPRSP